MNKIHISKELKKLIKLLERLSTWPHGQRSDLDLIWKPKSFITCGGRENWSSPWWMAWASKVSRVNTGERRLIFWKLQIWDHQHMGCKKKCDLFLRGLLKRWYLHGIVQISLSMRSQNEGCVFVCSCFFFFILFYYFFVLKYYEVVATPKSCWPSKVTSGRACGSLLKEHSFISHLVPPALNLQITDTLKAMLWPFWAPQVHPQLNLEIQFCFSSLKLKSRI